MANEFSSALAALLTDVTTAMERGAKEIMQQADVLVPKDTETLRESARILPARIEADRIIVEMGFGFGGAINPKTGNAVDTYTVPVHEILEAHHEPPTKAHFLQDPLFAYAGHAESSLTAELRIAWGKRLPGASRGVPSGTSVHAFGGGYSLRDLISGRFV